MPGGSGGRAPSLQSSDPSSPPRLFSLVILSVADRILESPAVLAVFSFPFHSVGFASRILRLLLSSVTQLCSALFSPVDCSTPGFPVHHRLLELAQNLGPSR